MQRFFRFSFFAAMVTVTGLGAAAAPALAGEPAPLETGCLTAAGIQDELAEGHVLRFAAIRHKLKGDIVQADLCRDDGKLDYRVTILTPEGAVRRLRVDATSGEMVYSK